MPKQPVRLVLVGLEGFGVRYLEALQNPPSGSPPFEVAAGVDPCIQGPSSSKPWAFLKQNGVPLYASLDDFFQNGEADIAVLATPIFLHASQTIDCLENGLNVLCEKPAAVLVEQAEAMARASWETGRFAAIGFQWSYADPVIRMKRDILSGLYGNPVEFRNLVAWPRADRYYQRTSWAGKLKDTSGQSVLDSPVSNATSHFMHHGLFLGGRELKKSAQPSQCEAELYRANPIESYDTAVVKVHTEQGYNVLHCCSHACENVDGPVMRYRFSKGHLTYNDPAGSGWVGLPKIGDPIFYGDPEEPRYHFTKLWDCLRCIQEGDTPYCPVEAALPSLWVANQTHQVASIQDLPKEQLQQIPHKGGILTYHPEMNERLRSAFLSKAPPGRLFAL